MQHLGSGSGSEDWFLGRDVRTSQGTFMSRHDDPQGVISWIEEKAAQLTGLPVSHGEVGHPTLAL